MGEYFVFLLGDSNRAVQTKIVLGFRINDKTIIKDGLNGGEKIITDGVQKVRDGSVVRVATDSVKITGAQAAH